MEIKIAKHIRRIMKDFDITSCECMSDFYDSAESVNNFVCQNKTFRILAEKAKIMIIEGYDDDSINQIISNEYIEISAKVEIESIEANIIDAQKKIESIKKKYGI